MACTRLNPLVACLAAGSLFISSTGAVAASATAAAPQQIHPWAALSALSAGAPAAAICGATAATVTAQTAQGCVLPVTDAPPPVVQGPPPPTPVPPVEPMAGGFGINPLYLALGALAAGALIYFLLIKKDKDDDEDLSPA